MRKQLIAVVAVTGLAPLALAAPASAAPGNGAQRYNVSECYEERAEPDEPLFQYCFTARGVSKVTQTPSGNFHMIDNGTHTFTATVQGEDFKVSGTSRNRFKALLKDGQVQVEHFRDRFTNAFGDVTCSGIIRFMIVKGEVKKRLLSVSCDGELPADPLPEPELES